MRKTNTRARALQGATYATLRGRAITQDAKALVKDLCEQVTAYEMTSKARKNQRKSTAAKMQQAVGAFAADLLLALSGNDPRQWVYRALHAQGFTGEPVTYRMFSGLVGAMERLGLVERASGVAQWAEGFTEYDVTAGREIPGTAKAQVTSRKAARFRASHALVKLANRHRVPVQDAGKHFDYDYILPKQPLQKRKANLRNSRSQNKVRGELMEFEPTSLSKQLEGEVRELNEFLKGQTIEGGIHHGYVRIFQNGDQPGFAWNLGGWLYSQPSALSYQQTDKDARLRMTINGEAVSEIDIRASYLTLFHAMHGKQLDLAADPYTLPGFGGDGRDIVKLWMVATFGSTKAIRRWPTDLLKDYEEQHGKQLDRITYPVSVVRTKALAAFPLLDHWGEVRDGRVCSWADLMYRESEVVVSTMLELKREHGVPSLAVHDSIIVPKSKADLAAAVLKERFQKVTGITPQLVIQGSGSRIATITQ